VREFCDAWGIRHTVLPVTDAPIATILKTDEGDLAFQEYFVHRRCRPRVRAFEFSGADSATPAPGVAEALTAADAVILCPSNPWVSIAPILAVPGIRRMVGKRKGAAVSPIVGGRALRGPADKMYTEMGIKPSALAVATQYQGLVAGFIMDTSDAALGDSVRSLGMCTLVTNTIMRTPRGRQRLARDVLNFLQADWE